MSDTTPNPEGVEGAPVEAMPFESPRRAASLTLRADDVRESRAESMDAANKSLADALRITYRLIQLVMLALVGLFAFSGFQKVDQGERGVKIQFGKLEASDLEPGFHFSLPYPLGQIRKVSTAQLQVNLDDSFFPMLGAEQKVMSLDALANPGQGSLRPGIDGSLITGDGNLAHARFTVTYHRDQPSEYIENLYEPDEGRLMMGVVQRAAVETIAQVGIDDMLKRGYQRPGADATPAPGGTPTPAPDAKAAGDGKAAPDPKSAPAPATAPAATNVPAAATRSSIGSEIEERIRRNAQAALDKLKVGLRIDAVTMRDATPPFRVRNTYQSIQSAESKSSTEREKAEKERGTILSQAAGGQGFGPLLALIDQYGRQIDLKDEKGAEATLMLVFDVLDGKYNTTPEERAKGTPKSLEVAGEKFTDFVVGGEASAIVSESIRYRSNVVQQAKGQSETFKAKLSQYRANPRVFITREWADAMVAFLRHDEVEAMVLPHGTSQLELAISRDPDIVREMSAKIKNKAIQTNWQLRSAYDAGMAPADKR